MSARDLQYDGSRAPTVWPACSRHFPTGQSGWASTCGAPAPLPAAAQPAALQPAGPSMQCLAQYVWLQTTSLMVPQPQQEQHDSSSAQQQAGQLPVLPLFANQHNDAGHSWDAVAARPLPQCCDAGATHPGHTASQVPQVLALSPVGSGQQQQHPLLWDLLQQQAAPPPEPQRSRARRAPIKRSLKLSFDLVADDEQGDAPQGALTPAPAPLPPSGGGVHGGWAMADVLQARGGPLEDAEARLVVFAAAQQLYSLHDAGRAHGRLSLSAVAADSCVDLSSIRLCGLDGAVHLDELGRSAPRPPPACPHSLACLAPEAWSNRPVPCTAAHDMWALGVVLFQCLTGGLAPFQDHGPQNVAVACGSSSSSGSGGGGSRSSSSSSSALRPTVDDLQCWLDVRLSEQLARHAHLPLAAQGLLRMLLRADPAQRLTAHEVLAHEWMVGLLQASEAAAAAAASPACRAKDADGARLNPKPSSPTSYLDLASGEAPMATSSSAFSSSDEEEYARPRLASPSFDAGGPTALSACLPPPTEARVAEHPCRRNVSATAKSSSGGGGCGGSIGLPPLCFPVRRTRSRAGAARGVCGSSSSGCDTSSSMDGGSRSSRSCSSGMSRSTFDELLHAATSQHMETDGSGGGAAVAVRHVPAKRSLFCSQPAHHKVLHAATTRCDGRRVHRPAAAAAAAAVSVTATTMAAGPMAAAEPSSQGLLATACEWQEHSSGGGKSALATAWKLPCHPGQGLPVQLCTTAAANAAAALVMASGGLHAAASGGCGVGGRRPAPGAWIGIVRGSAMPAVVEQRTAGHEASRTVTPLPFHGVQERAMDCTEP